MGLMLVGFGGNDEHPFLLLTRLDVPSQIGEVAVILKGLKEVNTERCSSQLSSLLACQKTHGIHLLSTGQERMITDLYRCEGVNFCTAHALLAPSH